MKRELTILVLVLVILLLPSVNASPIITIDSPLDKIYSITDLIYLNWTSNINLTWVVYSVDGASNITQSEVSTFNDSTTSKQYTFTDTTTFVTYYVEVPKEATINNAKIKIKGTNYSVDNERINVSEDTFVDSGMVDSNFGTKDYIDIYNRTEVNPRYTYGFFKYPITTTQYTFMSTTDAKVYFSPESHYDYYLVPTYVCKQPNTAWTELGLTWNNKPSVGTTIAQIPYGYEKHFVDITDYVNDIGNNEMSLELITVTTSNTNKKWASKETELKSYLVLDYYSTKPTIQIDVGNDNHNDIDTTTTNSYIEQDLNITAIQNYIDNNCNTDICDVPLNITSSTVGIMNIKDIDISWNLTNVNTNIGVFERGRHNITVWGNDTNGNIDNTSIYFTVSYPISIIVQSPTNTSYNNNWVWTNVTVTDIDSISSCCVSLNSTVNQSLTNSSGNWNLNLSVPSEGGNNVIIYCNDSYGSINSTQIYFTIDTVQPVINSVSANITDVDLDLNLSVLLSSDVTDVNGSISSVIYQVTWQDGSKVNYTASGSNPYTHSLPVNYTYIQTVGDISYKTIVTDVAGNTITSSDYTIRTSKIVQSQDSISQKMVSNSITASDSGAYMNITLNRNLYFYNNGTANILKNYTYTFVDNNTANIFIYNSTDDSITNTVSGTEPLKQVMYEVEYLPLNTNITNKIEYKVITPAWIEWENNNLLYGRNIYMNVTNITSISSFLFSISMATIYENYDITINHSVVRICQEVLDSDKKGAENCIGTGSETTCSCTQWATNPIYGTDWVSTPSDSETRNTLILNIAMPNYEGYILTDIQLGYGDGYTSSSAGNSGNTGGGGSDSDDTQEIKHYWFNVNYELNYIIYINKTTEKNIVLKNTGNQNLWLKSEIICLDDNDCKSRNWFIDDDNKFLQKTMYLEPSEEVVLKLYSLYPTIDYTNTIQAFYIKTSIVHASNLPDNTILSKTTTINHNIKKSTFIDTIINAIMNDNDDEKSDLLQNDNDDSNNWPTYGLYIIVALMTATIAIIIYGVVFVILKVNPIIKKKYVSM